MARDVLLARVEPTRGGVKCGPFAWIVDVKEAPPECSPWQRSPGLLLQAAQTARETRRRYDATNGRSRA